MSNFSNIGFAVDTEDQYFKLCEFCFNNGQIIRGTDGAYYIYSDNSGAELYGQLNSQGEFIGMNPHFTGKSKRKVCLTESYSKLETELDGAFHCWAEPQEENKPESGIYPFTFEVPNFKTIGRIVYPKTFEIQLSAFAQELELYEDEKAFSHKQNSTNEEESKVKFAPQSFVPGAVLSKSENSIPNATVFFAGIIKDWKSLKNEHTNETFTWLFVETLGGQVDIIFDPKLTNDDPKIGGIVQGVFWLSGKLIEPPFQGDAKEKKKSFLQKLFR